MAEAVGVNDGGSVGAVIEDAADSFDMARSVWEIIRRVAAADSEVSGLRSLELSITNLKPQELVDAPEIR